jgi:hypothetical protein
MLRRFFTLPFLLVEMRLFKTIRWCLPRSVALLWGYSIMDALAEQDARAE